MSKIRIYIVGSVASGKSTLARRISQITYIPCYHLDEIVYVEDASDSWGNRKRPVEERDCLFQTILKKENYIIEDAGRECFLHGMAQADIIILLETPLIIRKKRILFRWIKQNLGIEQCIYKPHCDMLKAMFRWAKDYDTGKDGTKGRVSKFKDKVVVLHNNKEIRKFLKTQLAGSSYHI
ncbi:MAG TPA: hypothetical protein H9662_09230 [Firmicutes bacterium]|nr:hypothetical protein [Bacillota bacterium]